MSPPNNPGRSDEEALCDAFLVSEQDCQTIFEGLQGLQHSDGPTNIMEIRGVVSTKLHVHNRPSRVHTLIR